MKAFDVSLGTFVPVHQPEDLDLVDALPVGQEVEKQPGAVRPVQGPGGELKEPAGRPLTAEEATLVHNLARSLQKEIAQTKAKINRVIKRIDEIASKNNNPEITFNIDLSKRAALRRAVQKAFGTKANTLTYSMYVEALRARKELQEEEANTYLGALNGQEE